MRFLKTRILFSSILFNLIVFSTYSQLVYIKGKDNFIDITKYNPGKQSYEEIVNYFLKLGQVKKIEFVNIQNQKKEYDLDSLLPQIKRVVKKITQKTLVPPKVLENQLLLKIYERSQRLRINEYASQEYAEVVGQIESLPNTQEKIWILIELFNHVSLSKGILDIKLFNKFCSHLTSIAEKIKGLPDKSAAYKHIGNFAQEYHQDEIAIKMYNKAIENIFYCNCNKKYQYTNLGSISIRIGQIFTHLGNQQSFTKAVSYYLSAIRYYIAAENEEESEICSLQVISALSFGVFELKMLQNDILDNGKYERDKLKLIILDVLQKWYLNINDSPQLSRYYGFYAIASLFSGEEKNNNVALRYYIKALLEAIYFTNPTTKFYGTYNGLLDVAFTYADLGREKLAIEYVDLAKSLAEQVNTNRLNIYTAIYSKAAIYYSLKRYDSALIYLSKIDWDSCLNDSSYTYHNFQYKWSNLKYKVITSLKFPKDSLLLYERILNRYANDDLYSYSHLIEIESDANKNLLERIKDLEINEKEKLTYILKIKDSISLSASRDSTVKAINEKMQSDSIANLRLKIKSDSIAKAESDKKSAQDTAEQEKRINEISNWAIAGLVVFLISLATIFLIFRKNSRLKLQTSNKDYNLRSAVRDHNLSNHYSKIKALLEMNILSKVIDYCEANCTYFDEFYITILEDKVSLAQEINNFMLFVETEKIYKEKPISIILDTRDIDLKTTAFLPDILAPLYENVLLKGYIGDKEEYKFVIEIKKTNKILECRIYDNGEGNKNIQSVIRENSYLDMLPTRIHNYFRMRRIKINKSEVFQIDSKEKIGTEIKFKIPYEKIQDATS